MATSYSSLLRLELPGNGEQSGIWGSTTNNNLGTLLDQAIAGTASITMLDADYTLSAYNGVTDESRQMILNIGGTLTANRNIICPATSKLYVIKNNTTGGFSVTLKTASGTGVTVTSGNTTIAYCDNTNVVDSVTALPAGTTVGGVAIVTTTGTQTLTNKTLTAPKFADGGFIADANGNEIVVLDTVTSAVNELTVANAATGTSPSISATGSDSNIDLLLVPKGTGTTKSGGVEVATISGSQTLTNKTITSAVLTTPRFADLGFIADANGNELIVMDTVTSAVNEIGVANAATGGAPTIAAQGGDTNVSLGLAAKGSGTIQMGSVASFGAGTVSAPSIVPTGDLNTGIWFPAADTISFATNGTEDFRMGSAGQLGIGGANYGTSGQVLTSGGSAAAPSWSTVSGTTSLGTANTTSGTSATVSGLTLTDYKFLIISLNGVSHNNSGSRGINVSSSTTSNTGAPITENNISDDTLIYVQAFLNLANGAASGNSKGGLSGITNASTSVSLVLSGSGSFDAGSFTVFGIR
jgi:hypothetical protein